MNAASIHFDPNGMGWIVMQAMKEILGQNEVDAVINQVDFAENYEQDPALELVPRITFEHLGRLQEALEHVYGSQAGRGLSQRVGSACLKYGLREFAPGLGLTDLSFRLLPLPARLKTGSKALIVFFNQFADWRVDLGGDEMNIHLHFDRCPLCWNRQTDSPCCAMVVGFLKEAMYWVSGGKIFLVEEKECIACGDTKCTIVINQTPIS
jgi:hypothetical protein